MLVILPIELASSYNDCLPSALVPRCNASSTRQRAQGNTRRAHLSLKCFASTDADTSPPHPAGLLLLRMALFQNSATTAVRLRQRPLANVGTSSLPLTHTRAPTCAQPPVGSSCHIQTTAAQALHHFLHEHQIQARTRPAPKCKMRRRANIISVN